jgi:hypothetical protein
MDLELKSVRVFDFRMAWGLRSGECLRTSGIFPAETGGCAGTAAGAEAGTGTAVAVAVAVAEGVVVAVDEAVRPRTTSRLLCARIWNVTQATLRMNIICRERIRQRVSGEDANANR